MPAEEEQVEVEVAAVYDRPLLAGHESEATTDFEREGLQIAQDCGLHGFQVLLQVRVPKVEGVEDQWFAERVTRHRGPLGDLGVRNLAALVGIAADRRSKLADAGHLAAASSA